jgi:hypothetical protein
MVALACRTACRSLVRAIRNAGEQLLDVLRSLTLTGGVELVTFIQSQDWSSVDFDTRCTCLHEINERITKLREQANLTPFDDVSRPRNQPDS